MVRFYSRTLNFQTLNIIISISYRFKVRLLLSPKRDTAFFADVQTPSRSHNCEQREIRFIYRLLKLPALSLLLGLSGALRQLALLLLLRRPSGYGFRAEPSVSAELRHLGAGSSRLAPPGVTRARSGNSTNGEPASRKAET